jgi:2-succinyl-5-enolpyruvyl-6-hydroxy-3-cyclohexene-1-carboxylate synthase
MKSKFQYTNERNVQIVIALLKAHGIHRVIASPGTTNMTFVVSIQHDPWFQLWSSVDERSAAYLACGMAAETGEPVVISCTGATASRNYMPGLTEAYYRKLPVLAITSTRGNHRVGHLVDQQIDRRNIPNDIAMESVTIPMVKDAEDERMCELEANKAILALKLNGGGPAHINLYTRYSKDFSIKELPHASAIYRHTIFDELPPMPKDGRIAIFVGAHANFTEKQVEVIDRFCATHDAVVFCDHTSGYRGKYEVHFQISFGQQKYVSPLKKVNLLIHIGEVSGSQFLPTFSHVWRVSPDGELRDTWGKLRRVFMMPEEEFFNHYSEEGTNHTEYLDALNAEIDNLYLQIPELPFSNLWMAQQIHSRLPVGCEFHMGIYHSLRSYNFFKLPSGIQAKCNVGGFGIDGGVSTMMGASFANPEKLFIGVFGDLAFFYDMNVVGNRHVGNNVRILLVNNGKGNEFRNYQHPCYFLGEEAEDYVAAARHYGNKSDVLVKNYAENLGYEYMTANSKESFLAVIDHFLSPELTNQPMLLEVFTETQDESYALEQILNVANDSGRNIIISKAKTFFKSAIRDTLGDNRIQAVKGFIKG